MRQMSFAGALAVLLVTGNPLQAVQATPAASAPNDTNVTITGCVVKGSQGGFLLTQVNETIAAAASAARPGSPVAATTTSPARVLYWLDDEDELKAHAGHKVEVSGALEGEIRKGEMEVERKGNGMIDIEAKYNGKRVKALVPELPSSLGTNGPVGDKEININFIVRRIDVKSVKMLADTCR